MGLGYDSADHVDLTPPEAVNINDTTDGNTLALIGAPVYAGRLPVISIDRFKRLSADRTPAVIVAVYGNREVEDALLELRDLATEIGFKPVAAGTFIGEHAFNKPGTPLAPGRPDATDLTCAETFGSQIMEKIKSLTDNSRIEPLSVPGNFPYVDKHPPTDKTPTFDTDLCRTCRNHPCVDVCPTAAISISGAGEVEVGSCILCNACGKICPSAAVSYQVDEIKEAISIMMRECREPKQPETFL